MCFSNSVPLLHVLLSTLAINRVVLHHNSSRKANYIPRSQGNVGYRRPTINLVGATENKRWKTLLNLRDTPAPDVEFGGFFGARPKETAALENQWVQLQG